MAKKVGIRKGPTRAKRSARGLKLDPRGSTPKLPAFVTNLEKALVQGLRESGIKARVDARSVPNTKAYRVFVLASEFKNLLVSERQDMVWRIANKALDPKDQLKISMILTLTPDQHLDYDEFGPVA